MHAARRSLPALLALAAPLLGAGCAKLDHEGWLNKPVPITLVQNMPLVQLRYQGGGDIPALVDAGTSVNVIVGAGGRTHGELRLQDGAFPKITRFIFRDLEVYDVPLAAVGLNTTTPIQGVLGAALLRNFALHLTYGPAPALVLKDEIPGTSLELAQDCDPRGYLTTGGTRPPCLGVFGATPLGGGLTAIAGQEVELPGTRLVLPLCLQPAPFDPTLDRPLNIDKESGTSLLAVVMTGLGTSVISRNAAERLRVAGVTLGERPGQVLHLPYGVERGSLVTVARAAAVSDETIDLGPCGELARRRRLLVAARAGLRDDDREKNGASVALLTRPLELFVLDDASPLIQGLRQELAPFAADVDVVLGGSFFSSFEVDLDYPQNRILLACADRVPAAECQVLPFCSATDAPRCPIGTATAAP